MRGLRARYICVINKLTKEYDNLTILINIVFKYNYNIKLINITSRIKIKIHIDVIHYSPKWLIC